MTDNKHTLNPQKLVPPPEIAMRIMQKDKERGSKNPIINFFKAFFGEGF